MVVKIIQVMGGMECIWKTFVLYSPKAIHFEEGFAMNIARLSAVALATLALAG